MTSSVSNSMGPESIDTVSQLAETWISSLVHGDFGALHAALHPAVAFRALVPGEGLTSGGAAEVVGCFRRWFGDKTGIEVLDQHAVMLVDRLRITLRARVRKGGQPYLIEQTLWGDLEEGKLATVDLLCSGFRPEGVSTADHSIHIFDAGDLGCGTGLPREFRARLGQIPVGHVLETITTDPSAVADLPAMARMLGHQVRSVETGQNGRITIRVERSQ
jgi:TusA-related sulfurtransferase